MVDDPYKVLGVSPDATDDEIKQAYRRLAKKYHPDLNPGDEAAAKKMQQVNAAYEQIKNPDKAGSAGSYSGGYNPFTGQWQQSYRRQQSSGSNYHDMARQYIRFGRYREALNVLASSSERNARWYYLSALANNGLGNQVTALEHIRRAVSMEPDNPDYLYTLDEIENGGSAYRRRSADFSGFSGGGSLCTKLCLCYALQFCCCRGRFFC